MAIQIIMKTNIPLLSCLDSRRLSWILIVLVLFGRLANVAGDLSEDQVQNAVITYYSEHHVQALNYLDQGQFDTLAPTIWGMYQKIRAYEVKNHFAREIDGEQHEFYDVAVETTGAAGDVIELLPFDIVQRGNSWYWNLDREREIQQLPKGSLSNHAIPVTSAEDKAENEGKAPEEREREREMADATGYSAIST